MKKRKIILGLASLGLVLPMLASCDLNIKQTTPAIDTKPPISDINSDITVDSSDETTQPLPDTEEQKTIDLNIVNTVITYSNKSDYIFPKNHNLSNITGSSSVGTSSGSSTSSGTSSSSSSSGSNVSSSTGVYNKKTFEFQFDFEGDKWKIAYVERTSADFSPYKSVEGVNRMLASASYKEQDFREKEFDIIVYRNNIEVHKENTCELSNAALDYVGSKENNIWTRRYNGVTSFSGDKFNIGVSYEYNNNSQEINVKEHFSGTFDFTLTDGTRIMGSLYANVQENTQNLYNYSDDGLYFELKQK